MSNIELLHKCPRSRIAGMKTYKMYLSGLQNYYKPVIIKTYDENNIHLHIEQNILKTINGFRNSALLICDFSCNDDKNMLFTNITNALHGCSNGMNKLHFFVYEYIANGDVSDFLTKHREIPIIKSLILQITCVIIQLASIYKIYHNDINSGNILIDTTNEPTIDYCISGETFFIESHGILPKIIDYGRSNFYQGTIPNNQVWFDVIMALSVIHRYIENDELKEKIYKISQKTDLDLPLLRDYFIFVRDSL